MSTLEYQSVQSIEYENEKVSHADLIRFVGMWFAIFQVVLGSTLLISLISIDLNHFL